MTTRAGDSASVLALQAIDKRFGDVVALDRASFALRGGTVHALLGENGAGKTTLMRVAFGLVRPDAGRIRLDAAEHVFRTPADAIAAGIGMVHQHFTHVAAMTVAENVALGGAGLYRPGEAADRVRDIGGRTGLHLDPLHSAGALGVGAQQRLEILKALARDARILILDEPTAVLAPAEADDLLAWLRKFADGGQAVVLITHKLREALSVADEVTVLRHGRTVLTSRATDASADALATAMVGESSRAPVMPPVPSLGEIVLRLDDVTMLDTRGVLAISGASLEVREGEILGVAGVEGSGHTELLRAMAGRLAVESGHLDRPDTVAFIPEDRHRDALVLSFDLTQNVALSGAGRRRGRVDWSEWRSLTERVVRDADVRGGSIDSQVSALSGGNQQKLVLARELRGTPRLVVAENPTRGLDIRATAAVHQRLREAASRGMAAVVYSSDLDEVLMLATRVVAVHAGRVREVPASRQAVGRAILGLT